MIATSMRPFNRKWSTVSFASTLHLSPVLELLLADVPAKWRPDLHLGLQEALVNAAKHGNNLDPSKTVLVKFFTLSNQRWWIIADQGSGFSPGCCCVSQVDSNSQELADVGECGRGLYILHQIFDQVLWNKQGTELRLCKEMGNRARLPLVRPRQLIPSF
ncbi:MAG: ATP-binding protein [Timaviella obliquedivisa GSE-PSE-MK23-08B]|nr:ATP-binding protein [Timaviella obliquedivisa GSE-PSE-MK23-08B]